jgi:hypothetical protein
MRHARAPHSSSIAFVLLVFNTWDAASSRYLRGKRTALKMDKLDAVILFAINSDQPKSGLALFSIPDGRDLAIAGQDSNGTVDSNLFIGQLDCAKAHCINFEIIQNLCLGECAPVGSNEHIVVGVDLRQLLQIVLPECSIEVIAVGSADFLGCDIHDPINLKSSCRNSLRKELRYERYLTTRRTLFAKTGFRAGRHDYRPTITSTVAVPPYTPSAFGHLTIGRLRDASSSNVRAQRNGDDIAERDEPVSVAEEETVLKWHCSRPPGSKWPKVAPPYEDFCDDRDTKTAFSPYIY